MALKTVYIELVAETKRLLGPLKKADREVSAFTKTAKKLGIALAGVFGARRLFRGFQQAFTSLNHDIRMAKGVGFATNEYQRFIFALDRVGVSAGAAKIALGDLQKRVGAAAAGNKTFAKRFKEAGLDPKELVKLAPAEQVEVALQALLKFRGNQALLVAKSGGVFEEQAGKDFAKLVNSFEEFVAARKDYDRIVGRGMTKKDERAFVKLDAQVKNLNLSFKQLKRRVVLDVAPGLETALQQLVDSGVFKRLGDEISELTKNSIKEFQLIAKWINKWDAGMQRVIDKYRELEKRFIKDPILRAAGIAPAPSPVAKNTRGGLPGPMTPGFGRNYAVQGPPPALTPSGSFSKTIILNQTFNGIKERSMPARAGQASMDGVNRATEAP
jgi:hypothetical protein